MASKQTLKFVTRDQRFPGRRPADARRNDFNEIYPDFTVEDGCAQAGRCSQCGVPFCQVHCPLHNNIPDWLMLNAEGRRQEAYEMAASTNTFPEICGRICPQDRLCEGNCVLEQSDHGTVTIGAVERHITEHAFDQGWVKPPQPARERAGSVGIIGAGPAGLAAADRLRRSGWQVTVYDRHDRVGGLLVYGIPGFKLEKYVVQRRADLLAQGGVTFKLGFEVGRDATLDDLRQRHDAVLIAVGVYKARALDVPGAGLAGVVPALAYLTASNRTNLGDKVPEVESGALSAKGKRVVVVGGGDTAMDCVRTAIRQGAISVQCLYRRDRANMPGSQREVANAEEEGAEFRWMSLPRAFLGDDHVTGVRVQRMKLGPTDASGRQRPVPVEGSDETLDADMVIQALGFEPEDLPAAFACPDLPVSGNGRVVIDRATGMTGLDGVFAAGDIVRGAALVVEAIADGRAAADGIDAWLRRQAEAAEQTPSALAG